MGLDSLRRGSGVRVCGNPLPTMYLRPRLPERLWYLVSIEEQDVFFIDDSGDSQEDW